MKTLVMIVLLISVMAAAKPVDRAQLISYANKYALGDNRKRLNREKIYQTHITYQIKYDERAPRFSITGYGGPDKFNQIELDCNQCGVEDFSTQHIELCRDQFAKLMKGLWNIDIKPEIINPPQIPPSAWSLDYVEVKGTGFPGRIRLLYSRKKCDVMGSGRTIRIDIFP